MNSDWRPPTKFEFDLLYRLLIDPVFADRQALQTQLLEQLKHCRVKTCCPYGSLEFLIEPRSETGDERSAKIVEGQFEDTDGGYVYLLLFSRMNSLHFWQIYKDNCTPIKNWLAADKILIF